jgi:hypothetical protein
VRRTRQTVRPWPCWSRSTNPRAARSSRVAGIASGVTRQSLVSRSTTAGDSSPRSIVAGAGSTFRGRVANAAANSSTSHSTVAATVATSNGATSSGNPTVASAASSGPIAPPAASRRPMSTVL